jgi:hypothetical protein
MTTTGTGLNDHPELCEHVVEAWRLLLQIPESERRHVVEYLAATYAWDTAGGGAARPHCPNGQ